MVLSNLIMSNSKTKIIALLPMKGNSVRVKNKNLKLFSGRPLYHVILNKLLSCEFIDIVIINTDSKKIKEDIMNNFSTNRVKIHDRNINLVGDLVSMNKIIEYDLNNSDANIYIQTHSTNPLIKTKTLADAIKLFISRKNKNDEEYDSIFSVNKVQTRFYDSDCKPINHDKMKLIRTQDLPPFYEENSCFYIFSKKSFLESGCKRIGLRPKMFEISKIESTDIDNPDDFVIAESIYKTLQK